MQGDVSKVIDSLFKTVSDAGKIPRRYSNTFDLAQDCITEDDGRSPCFGAVVFLSSPEQGTDISEKGTWNYTIRGESYSYGGFVDVTKDTNAIEVYLMPLQRAVDFEIIAQSKSGNTSSLTRTTKTILYTTYDQSALDDSRTGNFLTLCMYAFGTLFTFTLVGIVYHMTSFVSAERELGMSGLIDTMIPGGSNIRGRLVRQIATYISFALVYLPSWIAVGVSISVIVFPNTSRGIPVAFTIFTGLALTSFSLFGASFFRKSQLSGSIMVVIALVFAVLPQTLYEQTRVACAVMSFIFPTATYTYFITGSALFELQGEKLQMWRQPEDDYSNWRINMGIHWIFLAIQIVAYPILAFCVEHLRFSTSSPTRTFRSPEHEESPTVAISSLSKTYKAGVFTRRQKDVHAVVDLSLNAYRGQILCLLGPNGSGKSTTMNCIAGQHKLTSGAISIDPSGGLGYAPQHNVIWPDLTVDEHVRIFSNLKCLTAVNDEIIADLVRMCDLEKKLPARAKTLSGGQKRKLQLAMMFAGGSAVCCVDEVSTGLDPISRRRIWEILLKERLRRTIIMTTHFLDEADYLSDNIVIMYKGSLRAEGTSAALKNSYGSGFTIKLPENIDVDITLSGPMDKQTSRHQVVFRVATAALSVELVEQLESRGIHDYQISGPTMEELFMKVTGDNINSGEQTSAKKTAKHTVVELEDEEADAENVTEVSKRLTSGHPITVFKQWALLVGKRLLILRRRWIPYFVVIAFAIVGAGIAPLLIKSFTTPMECPAPSELVQDTYSMWRDDLTYMTFDKMMFGPPDRFDDSRLAIVADVYSQNHTSYTGSYSTYGYGFHNATQLKDLIVFVDTYDDFVGALKKSQESLGNGNYYSSLISGGIWMGNDESIVAANVEDSSTALSIMNFMNILESGVPISAGHAYFDIRRMPDVFK